MLRGAETADGTDVPEQLLTPSHRGAEEPPTRPNSSVVFTFIEHLLHTSRLPRVPAQRHWDEVFPNPYS